MAWKIAEAKQRFSELIRESQKMPQIISNRDQVVAAVIDAETLVLFLKWKEEILDKSSIATAFEKLRELSDFDSFELEVPERKDRDLIFDMEEDEK